MELTLQGLRIEKQLAEISESEIEKVEYKPLYCLSVTDELFYSSMREILTPYLEMGDNLPIVSKIEFIGTIGYMNNVIREETSNGTVRYYSYIDKDHYYILDEVEALNNKIATWNQANGNLTRIYELFQLQGANIIFKDSLQNQTLSLKKIQP